MIQDLLEYKDIARAGQPVSLTGEAIVQLGALMSQMDFGIEDSEFTKEEQKLIEEQRAEIELRNKSEKAFGGPNELEKQGIERVEQLIKTNMPTLGSTLDRTTTKSKPVIGADNPVNENKFDFLDLTPTLPNTTNLSFATGNAQTGTVQSTLNRLKPEILEQLEGLRYKYSGKEDTPLRRVVHAAKTPFLQTDGVDYRQLKRAVIPEYAKGRLGAAAAEGFNLVIDKYNYDQAVKADYEEELDDQMGSLNVPAEFISDQARQNYLELAMGKKKQLNEAFNSWVNGKISKFDYSNIYAKLESEVKTAAAARTNLTNLRAEYLDKKGTYDIDASDKEMVDFYNTLEKSPEALSIKSIDGIDYVTGKTRGGQDIKVPVSKIANGTAGFRLVEKANLTPIITRALNKIEKYSRDVKTKFGTGQATASPEQAKQMGLASIKMELKADSNNLRSYMASLGVDHELYQQFLQADGNITEEMLNDAAEELYDTRVAELYFPQTKTTRFTTQSKVPTTQGERTAAEIQKSIDSFSIPTRSNIMSEWSTIIDKRKYKVQEDTEGNYYITDLKNEPIALLDFNKPQEIIDTFANIAGIRGKQKLPILNKK